ncbi:DUF3617 domain-containing protein [Asticcacaulis solisilvae]|uniref:DUF3617 domain-containing protein n=1 Tax=Asticcacaulis solisilvae TaxID=1217274 RepID=UPI003FD6C75C
MQGSAAAATPAATHAAPAMTVGAFKSPMAKKPGLWEMTIDMPDTKMKSVKNSVCVDETVAEKWMKAAGQMGANDVKCSKHDVTPTATGAVIDQVCETGGRTINSHIELTTISDTSFKQSIKSTTSPPVMGKSDSDVEMTANWMGACPSNMAAGDMEMDIPGVGKHLVHMSGAGKVTVH